MHSETWPQCICVCHLARLLTRRPYSTNAVAIRHWSSPVASSRSHCRPTTGSERAGRDAGRTRGSPRPLVVDQSITDVLYVSHRMHVVTPTDSDTIVYYTRDDGACQSRLKNALVDLTDRQSCQLNNVTGLKRVPEYFSFYVQFAVILSWRSIRNT